MMHALVEAGADIIELGVPFSDPMADGPVVQRACERALARGVNLRQVLDMVREFRQHDVATPVVLMGYLNPIEAMGYGDFARAAAEAGVDGVLVVDLPPEESHELAPLLKAADMDLIFLLAPTSSTERIERVAALASGYVYYVSLKGVTGSAALDVSAVQRKLATIREYVSIPVGVGFGIKDPASAAAVSRVADAVVVGSAIVERMGAMSAEAEKRAEILSLVSAMRQAMDTANV
jgi:tryptophan synthase alpha chain